MAAYNYGMEKIAEVIDNRMVISLSMAPTFPNHFAHARRIGCDQMYGGVEFTMNQLWGGWWQKEVRQYFYFLFFYLIIHILLTATCRRCSPSTLT